VAEGRRVDDQPRALDAADELVDGDLRLEPHQESAEAEVDARAVAEVLVVRALEVDVVRVREPARVAVRGGVHVMIGAPCGMIVPAMSMSAMAVRVG
jgi:hypothetical protein